ncbi:MAG TPA: TonB family protein [Oceanipulchritudo sp.]|nr:TonB family protein [Oceanipulchritudo sp.]
MKGGTGKLIRVPVWLYWMSFSAGLHFLAALSLFAWTESVIDIAVEEAPQIVPIQVAFVPPPNRPMVTEPPKRKRHPLVATESKIETEVVLEDPQERPQGESTPPSPMEPEAAEVPEPEVLPPEAGQPESESRPTKMAPPLPGQADSPMAIPGAEKMSGAQKRSEGPSPLINPAPAYPRAALARGWKGTVWLEVELCPRGHPQDCRIIESSGHTILDRKARQTVLRKWRFQAGKTSARMATVSIDFQVR